MENRLKNSMNQYEYGYEKVDLRLLYLLFLKKIWVVVASALGVALLAIFSLWMIKVVGPLKEFQAESMYYVEFSNGDMSQIYNDYTWGEWLQTDQLIHQVQANLSKEYSEDYLRNCIFAFLLSDVRMPVTQITTSSSEETLSILKATEQAVLTLANELKEIDNIRVITTAEQAKNTVGIDTYTRVAILAGGIAFFIAVTAVIFYFLWDSRIYLTNTLLKRYQIPTISNNRVDEMALQLVKDCKEKAEVYRVEDLWKNPNEMKITSNKDGVILVIEAQKTKRQQIEYVLDFIQMHGKKVDLLLLSGEDEKLVKTYYFMDKIDRRK